MLTRRELLASAAALAAFRNDALACLERLALPSAGGAPDDEDFWRSVRQAFALDANIVNFNNGGVSPSPRVVNDALRRQIEHSNQAPSYFMWRQLEPEIESVRRRLAGAFGCHPEEIALTRNASEALEICLLGLDLKPGDEVLTTTQDYPRMITTLKQRERREGIRLIQVRAPVTPKNAGELKAAFESGLTSRTKLILVSHVVFLTGQIYPVAEICALGRSLGIPVIVDGAHAFAQFPFSESQLGCEYYGCSLHKWLMAPVGAGFLHVKKDRIERLWPLMPANPEQSKDIRKFEEIGTHPAANHNAIGEALSFHEMLGAERKAARFRYLRERWTSKIWDHPRFRFHTNLSPRHSCALCTVELSGVEPSKLADRLLERHGYFVTAIGHEEVKGIRVSPNVYTTIEEVDRFAEAMLLAAKEM